MQSIEQYKVRPATENDLVSVLVMAKQFLKESGYGAYLSWDQNKSVESFYNLVNSPNTCVFVLECNNELVGMISAIYCEPVFSKDRVAAELAWWVDPEHRKNKQSLSLVAAYEQWCKDNKVKICNMMDLEALGNLRKVYEGLGYKLHENTYVKVL